MVVLRLAALAVLQFTNWSASAAIVIEPIVKTTSVCRSWVVHAAFTPIARLHDVSTPSATFCPSYTGTPVVPILYHNLRLDHLDDFDQQLITKVWGIEDSRSTGGTAG